MQAPFSRSTPCQQLRTSIPTETHLSAIIHFRQLTVQYEVSKCLWEILKPLLHLKPKLTSDLLGEGKGCVPPTTRGLHMKYDSIMFLLNSISVQLKC